jgi:hypothetical protein
LPFVEDEMDPFQISITVIASVYLASYFCLQIATHNRLDALREEGKYIGQHLRAITDKLEKLSKHEIKKPNIFLGTRIHDSPA